jgi:hypothetical protein
MEPALHRPQFTEAGSGNELKNQNREKEFLHFDQFVLLFQSPTRRRTKNQFLLLTWTGSTEGENKVVTLQALISPS